MAGEIIRLGDPTSHGGRVLEGSMTDICHGKPIAFKGHKTYCPLCKGIFPIIEGVLTMTFYGNGEAVAGMRTSCGASLIPTQFTAVVESGRATNAEGPGQARGHTKSAETPTMSAELSTSADHVAETEQEVFYSLVGEDDEPLEGFRYDLYTDGVLFTRAAQYDNGCTVTVKNSSDVRLVSWLAGDSGTRS